jgi:hypothetical protein
MSHTQVSFAAHAQRLVCPPPPASANGSVLSLAAPAEPGVGVDTPRPPNSILWRYRTSRGVLGRALDGERTPESVVRKCAENVIAGYAS